MIEKLNVMLDPGSIMPTRAHDTDAGIDLYTRDSFYLDGGKSKKINTGVHLEIPKGYVGMIKSKSGLNVNFDITSEGVIDSGFTGAIVVKMYNHGKKSHFFEAGNKISQLVLLPIETPELVLVDNFAPTDRGEAGFGSTGR